MTDRWDHISSWLSEPVQPLLPAPGAFERVRRRAYRRKLTRATCTVVAGAAVVAAAVAVPRLALAPPGHGHTVASLASHTPTHEAVSHRNGPPAGLATRRTRLAPGTTPPVPANFRVSSVTFVGTATGWVLGQAGTPGHCANRDPYICTSVARTDNGGRSWAGVPAPDAGAPAGSQGVGQIRFLNTSDGWAFGPQLWATHDGGHRWIRVNTGGRRVIALETRGSRAFAVWARCRGTAPAADCTSFSLYSASAGGGGWLPVPGVTGLAAPGGAASSAALVLTSGRGYLLAPDGELFSGPVSRRAGWQPVGPAGILVALPCSPGPAQPDGQPSQAMLTSTGPGLVLLCPRPLAGGWLGTVYYSADQGAAWQVTGKVALAGAPRSLSGTPAGPIVLATGQGIEVSRDLGRSWQAARGAMPPGGFSYLGMTTSDQGVAVPARARANAVWLSYDGGLKWAKSPVSSG
jgi:hypothetical protein